MKTPLSPRQASGAVSRTRTSLRKRSPDSVVLVAAIAGGAACAVGTVAILWARTGTTPPWLFDRLGTLRPLRSGWEFGGVPFEYFGFVWFAALLGLTLVRRGLPPGAWAASAFASGILLAGCAAAIAFAGGFATWTVNAAGVAGAVVLVAAAIEGLASPRALWTAVRDRRELLQTPALAVSVAALIALSVAGGLGLRGSMARISPGEAATRNFLNWYAWRDGLQDSASTRGGQIQVVAFTDYQCPSSGANVPRVEETIGRLQQADGIPIDIAIRDFPIDAACNPRYWASLHPAACEAAAAVRFVRMTSGADVARDLETQLYRLRGQIEPETIGRYLSERGLQDAFSSARAALLRDVTGDVVEALRLGVRHAPTFFVNGIKLPTPGYLEAAIRFERARTANPVSALGDLISGVVSEMLQGR